MATQSLSSLEQVELDPTFCSLLQYNTQIRAFNEIFHNDTHNDTGKIYWDYPSYCSRGIRQLKLNEPITFLDDVMFGEYPKPVSAVGFKLFYEQAQVGCWKDIWDYLRKISGLKIIHLTRKNILKTFVSRKIAQ